MKISDDDDRFAQELAIYKRLATLHGDVVPHLYGTATCVDRTGNGFDRVLLLQYIKGHQLSAIPPEEKHLAINMLHPTYEKLGQLNVIHGDPSLNNAIYVPAGPEDISSHPSWFRHLLDHLGLSNNHVGDEICLSGDLADGTTSHNHALVSCSSTSNMRRSIRMHLSSTGMTLRAFCIVSLCLVVRLLRMARSNCPEHYQLKSSSFKRHRVRNDPDQPCSEGVSQACQLPSRYHAHRRCAWSNPLS